MKKIACCTMAMLLLSSCNSKTEENYSLAENYDNIYVAEYADNYLNGRIVDGSADGNVNTPAAYVDYNTMEKTILCSKPNCVHNNTSCPANVMGTAPILTENSIYYFDVSYGVVEKKYGVKELEIKSRLVKMALDTAEIETIAEFNDCVPDNSRGFILYNNRIYFTGDDFAPTTDEYGGFFYSNIGGTHYLCSIDLETGEYINYGNIYDDKMYEGANCSSSARILGIYNSKMIINYEFCKTLEDAASANFTELVFEFDFDTNQMTLTDIQSIPVYVDSDTIIYNDYDINKCVVIDKGNRFELDIGEVTLASLLNNKLFVRDDKNNYALKWYDLSDMSEHHVKDYDGFMPVSIYYESYILTKGNKTVKLTEKDLLASDEE